MGKELERSLDKADSLGWLQAKNDAAGKRSIFISKRRKGSWGSNFNRGTFPGYSKSSTIRIWKTVTSLQSDENHPKKNRVPGSTQTSTVLTFPELSLLYPPASITDILQQVALLLRGSLA